jgi:type VI secretion system protein ImpF
MSGERRLTGSLLDRLTEETATGAGGGASSDDHEDVAQLLLTVRRDLERLLNARRRCLPCPPELQELNRSIVEYGIPDFTGLNMSRPVEREQTRQAIERAIKHFEPRLKDVIVTVLPSEQRTDRRLHLRITAVLRTQPLPERVEFDSEVDPSTSAVGVNPVL